MKKNWVFIVLSLAVLFSAGFLPTPVSKTIASPLLKPTSSAPVELTITNNTGGKAAIYLSGTPQNYALRLGSGQTGKLKVNPGKYTVWVMPEKCDAFGKDIKIAKKTKLTFKCGKVK